MPLPYGTPINPSKQSSAERGGRRLNLVDLPAPFKLVPVKLDGIVSYDVDNAYPSRIERLINASVTAKAAAGMYRRFLSGAGFKDPALNLIVVGREGYKDVTAMDLLHKTSRSFSYFNGSYWRLQYTGANISGVRLEPFRYCRLGEMDNTDYNGKIVVYNNWDKWRNSRVNKSEYLCIDVYNPDPQVIAAQVAAAGDFSKWKGQIYYNFLEDEYIYPLSPLDPVKWDADTETQISVFKNGELRRGFFLKYIMHHTRFNTDDEAQAFAQKMMGFMGGDHNNSMIVLEGSFDREGKIIDGENVKIEKVEQNINDKLFESYESSTQNSIRKAYNAIPQILIEYEDSKLGTTSGEALRQASEFYNQQTIEPRMRISQMFKEIFDRHANPALRGKDWAIEELILGTGAEVENIAVQALLEKRKAQATLKGSVGGVQALLEIQKSVSDGITDRTAAITIIEEIYGIDSATANKMLGTPNLV